jgi:crossover junction endodeoxyribonuclease RuvC
MRILGIDPGTIKAGYGVVESDTGRVRVLDCGLIRAGRGDLPSRLKSLFEALNALIGEFKPDCISLEAAFFGKNARSAMTLGEGRAVVLLCAALRGIPVHEYPPTVVKKSVAGRGNADKLRVRKMVLMLAGQPDAEMPPDVSDALAIAFCHLHRNAQS